MQNIGYSMSYDDKSQMHLGICSAFEVLAFKIYLTTGYYGLTDSLHNLANPKAIIAYKPADCTGTLSGGLKSTICESCKGLPALPNRGSLLSCSSSELCDSLT